MKNLFLFIFLMTFTFTFAGNDKTYLEIEETLISVSSDKVIVEPNSSVQDQNQNDDSCYFYCRECIIYEGVKYCTEWKCCVEEEEAKE